ncbi:alpha/beta hydrolase family protein [Rhodococcus gannanensis]|uniref:Alpha/beta hydrolase family protein n=1 Tax=Rhodococcus gannanensis TaxID=1960308 RepID=A0ABW4NYV8_9NOCA
MLRVTGLVAGLVAAALVVTSATVAHAVPADPGVVVGSPLTDPALGVEGASQVLVFTYRTAGADGLSTAQVLVPEGTAPDGGWPIVAWAHGTVGMADTDAPTRSGVVYDLYRTLFSDWLGRGFMIVATDYAGLGTPGVHPYLNADVAARNVVDSVRAARELVPGTSERWVAAGQSQGGHAALATALRAESLAPELDYRGTFASGAPTNLDRLVGLAGPDFPDLRLDGLTLYMAYIASGLRESRPDLDVNGYLTPAGRELVDAADTTPLAEFKPMANRMPVSDLFGRPLAGTPLPQAVTEYLGVPATGFEQPLMLVQGLADQTVPPALSLWFAADLTLAGEQFALRLPSGGHTEGLGQSVSEAGAFLERVLR